MTTTALITITPNMGQSNANEKNVLPFDILCFCEPLWAYLLDDYIHEDSKIMAGSPDQASKGVEPKATEQLTSPTVQEPDEAFTKEDEPIEVSEITIAEVATTHDDEVAIKEVKPDAPGIAPSQSYPEKYVTAPKMKSPPRPPPLKPEAIIKTQGAPKKAKKKGLRKLRKKTKSTNKIGSDKYRAVLTKLTEESGYSATDSVTSSQLRRQDLRSNNCNTSLDSSESSCNDTWDSYLDDTVSELES